MLCCYFCALILLRPHCNFSFQIVKFTLPYLTLPYLTFIFNIFLLRKQIYHFNFDTQLSNLHYQNNYLCAARDEGRGQEALKALQGEGLNPKFHQLDIDDSASITRLRNFLKEQYGGLDILVNNAGIAYKVSWLFWDC